MTDTRKTIVELFRLLAKCEDVRRTVVKISTSETQKKLRGLTLNQHTALEKIVTLTKTHPEGVTLREFAEDMQASPSSSSVMVDSLVNRGLIERVQNPEDRRTVLIRLSDKGLKIFSEHRNLVSKGLEDLLSKLSPEELQQLKVLVSKLAD